MRMDRQTLRDWVYRYNAGGLAGLSNRTAPGRTPYLSAAQKAELSEIVRAGPDPEVDRVVRWRRIDLKHLIKENERTVGHVERRVITCSRRSGSSELNYGRRVMGFRSF